jgi:hypothetical protein
MTSMVEAAWRFPVASSEQFDHLRNPSNFNVKFDSSLQREIVELKNVCWLQFFKQLGKHKPGRYVVRLRVFVNGSTQWHDGAPSQLSVNKIDRSETGSVWLRTAIITEPFSPAYWKSIANGTFQNQLLVRGRVIPDSGNWHLIELGPFDIQCESDLEFQFKDIDNPHWKKGMQYDFVELRLIAPSTILRFFGNIIS